MWQVPACGEPASASNQGGRKTFAVLYNHAGRQSSTTFARRPEADRFRKLVEALGADEALTRLRGVPVKALTVPTVAECVGHHIEHLTGVTDLTRQDYGRQALRHLGQLADLPVDVVGRDDLPTARRNVPPPPLNSPAGWG